MNASEVLSEDRNIRKGTDLVAEVIGALGRVDLFDAESLKALRATCRVFRDLVDATGIISTAHFNLGHQGGRDALEAWATVSRLTPHTRSLSIYGNVPEELAGQVLAALRTYRPPISNLKLMIVGAAADSLLTAPLDILRTLRLDFAHGSSQALLHMINNTSFSGLLSLSLGSLNDIDLSGFAALLAHFRDLKSLKLFETQIKSKHANEKLSKSTLARLEALEVGWGQDIDKLGLLGADSPALPALRTFIFKGDEQPLSTTPLWFSQLTKLSLKYADLTSPDVVEALSGGPLKELTVNLSSDDDAYEHWDWNDLELLHLTRLVHIQYYCGDAMGNVAHASLPALRSAMIPFRYSTVSSVEAFSAAFRGLGELQLLNKEAGYEETLPPTDALEALSREVVPRLETLKWSLHSIPANEVIALLRSLLPAGPADCAPCWPRLRSLDLDLETEEGHFNSEIQSGVYQTLVRAAPHMPGLVSLRALFANFGGNTRSEALDAFIAVAKEVQAWPLLRNMDVGYHQDISSIKKKLHEVWPQATVE